MTASHEDLKTELPLSAQIEKLREIHAKMPPQSPEALAREESFNPLCMTMLLLQNSPEPSEKELSDLNRLYLARQTAAA